MQFNDKRIFRHQYKQLSVICISPFILWALLMVQIWLLYIEYKMWNLLAFQEIQMSLDVKDLI